jgi:hypothetical protein
MKFPYINSNYRFDSFALFTFRILSSREDIKLRIYMCYVQRNYTQHGVRKCEHVTNFLRATPRKSTQIQGCSE